MQFQVEEVEGKYIVRLHGRVDTITAPGIEEKLHLLYKKEAAHVLVDFSAVDYLSSAGLRLLLSTSKKAKSSQGSFVIFSVDEDVLEIIKMAGFERVIAICKNETEALQAGS